MFFNENRYIKIARLYDSGVLNLPIFFFGKETRNEEELTKMGIINDYIFILHAKGFESQNFN